MTKQCCDDLIRDFLLTGAEYIHRGSGFKYELKAITIVDDPGEAGKYSIHCEFCNSSFSSFPQRLLFKFDSDRDTSHFERIRLSSLK